MIGRIFTLKSLESMQVAGENQEQLPELTAGFDDDGYFHGADFESSETTSQLVADAKLKPGSQVGLGHERALPGEAEGQMKRAVITIQPMIIRIGSLAGMMWRKIKGDFSGKSGAAVGPLLPTQMVRVTILGTPPQTRVVTALEAVGLLTPPSGEILNRAISATAHGYMWIMAGTGLARAFGPAIAEGLISGGEVRGVAAALLAKAGTEAGTSALLSALAIGGIEAIDRNRDEFSKTPQGRTFLELFDATMLIWVSHDVARLIGSGLIPRLAKSIDFFIAAPGKLRNAVLPLRDEIEAMRRAIARYSSPTEAAAAVAPGGAQIGAAAAGTERPNFFTTLRVTRAEVASERLVERLSGSTSEPVARRVLDRLGSLVERSDTAATAAGTDETARIAAEKTSASAAKARLTIANRAANLRPDARDTFLRAVDGVISTRPSSLDSLTDLLTAAATSRQPTVFIAEVQRLVSRKDVTNAALRELGKKVLAGPDVLDLAWLNRTKISDSALDFLGKDKRTPWDLYRRAAADPSAGGLIKSFRTSARGAGAEMVAEVEAARLGTKVNRQVPMGTSEIDFDLIVAGARRGLEIKGWTVQTWREALELALQRLKRGAPELTAAEKKIVGKIDKMIGQLNDIQTTTGKPAMLGFTDAMPDDLKHGLRRVLEKAKIKDAEFIPLSESKIKEKAAGAIGESLGIPRP